MLDNINQKLIIFFNYFSVFILMIFIKNKILKRILNKGYNILYIAIIYYNFTKENTMIKLELIINETRIDEVKEVLRDIGIKKISLSEVKEYDQEYTHEEGYRGTTYIIDFIKKVNISILLNSNERIERTLHMLSVANIDADVLVYEVMQSYHISKRIPSENDFTTA